MNQKSLSKWLKVVIIGIGLCGFLIYLYILPFWGKDLAFTYPEVSNCYWPWLFFLWVTAIPCYAVLVCGWNIVHEIGKDHSFCLKNSYLLKIISILAAGNSAFFFLGNLVFLILNMSHPGIFLLSLLVCFAGIAVTVVAASLSHLVYKAAQLREENDLTI